MRLEEELSAEFVCALSIVMPFKASVPCVCMCSCVYVCVCVCVWCLARVLVCGCMGGGGGLNKPAES